LVADPAAVGADFVAVDVDVDISGNNLLTTCRALWISVGSVLVCHVDNVLILQTSVGDRRTGAGRPDA
jgi:hypothetical protein